MNIAFLYSEWHLVNYISLNRTGKTLLFVHNYEDENSILRIVPKDLKKKLNQNQEIEFIYLNVNKPFNTLSVIFSKTIFFKTINIITAGDVNYFVSIILRCFNKVNNIVIDEGTSSYYESNQRGLPSKLNVFSGFMSGLKKIIQIPFEDKRFFYFENDKIHVNQTVKKNILKILKSNSPNLLSNCIYEEYDLVILDNMNEIFMDFSEKELFLNTLFKQISSRKIIVKCHPNDLINGNYKILPNKFSAEEILFKFKFKNIHSGISTAGLNAYYLLDLKVNFFHINYLSFKITDFYHNRVKNFNNIFFNE